MNEPTPTPSATEYGRLVTPGSLAQFDTCRWCDHQLMATTPNGIRVCLRCDTNWGNRRSVLRRPN